MKNNICLYCNRKLKNERGVKIHQKYCRVKTFSEMKKQLIGWEEYQKVICNSYFISLIRYAKEFHKFLITGEVGILKDVRLVLKKDIKF